MLLLREASLVRASPCCHTASRESGDCLSGRTVDNAYPERVRYSLPNGCWRRILMLRVVDVKLRSTSEKS